MQAHDERHQLNPFTSHERRVRRADDYGLPGYYGWSKHFNKGKLHNVIGTFLVYQWNAGDNRGLLPTFGHESTLSFIGSIPCSLTFSVTEMGNPLFKGIGSTYVSSGYSSCELPGDGTWDGPDLAGARFVAKAADNKAVITVYDGPCYVAIFISSMPEYYGNTQDKQWFYNAITYPRTCQVPVGGTVIALSPTMALLPWIFMAVVAVGAGAYVMRKRYTAPLLARTQ